MRSPGSWSRSCSRAAPRSRSVTSRTTPTGRRSRTHGRRLFEGLSLERARRWDTVFLWWHSLIILGFLVYITYSKHLHIVTAGINVLFTSERPKGALKPMDIDIEEMSEDDIFGAGKLTDLTWKTAARRDDVHRVRTLPEPVPRVEHRQAAVSEAADHGHPRPPVRARPGTARGEEAGAGGLPRPPSRRSRRSTPTSSRTRSIWDCTTCGACVQACPVNIEHIDTSSTCDATS